MATKQRHALSTRWKWRLADANGISKADSIPDLKTWTPVTAFPSVVQMELLAKKIIPDPNLGENERQIQWVGGMDWEYSCSFPTPNGLGNSSIADLVFEGLDTFATVSLNGREILKSDNMFIPYRVDVTSHLNPVGQENELLILFESALKKGDELEAKFGPRKQMIRDKRRNHIRKAQYHWGWDWGPIMVTAGPYMPIYLETYSARLDNVYITTELAGDHSTATLTIGVQATGPPAMVAKVTILDQALSQVSQEFDIALDNSKKGSASVTIIEPKLWWPNGQGPQHLYNVSVSLLDESSDQLDASTIRYGIRTIKVIQRPLDNAPGKTFLFNVNGRDIFSQGGNWIPGDNLLPTMTRERYFDWIRLSKYHHLNMIRVWGGGIYETEDFFDACDEMGMLVWHDYAFACGDYPVHKEFLDSVKAEAEAQTIRMRNRASLALLCGNNEDFGIQDFFGEPYDFKDHQGPFENSTFPARKIYLDLLPKVCESLCPTIQYWPSSPWGEEGVNASDTTFGDLHQWAVWHGPQHSYQKYGELSGRFISEFGMHGFPIMRTVDVFAPDPKDRHPQSRTIDCHNKGHGAETRIARYLSENFRYDMKLENFAYCSQLLQSEAYGYALRDWKRKFGGKGKEECAGAIIWQLNDVYPVTSWAYIDYYLRPKPAFYTIRRNFAPISVGIERTPRSRWIDEDKPKDSYIPNFALFAHNTTSDEVKCTLEMRAYDLHSGKAVDLNWAGVSSEVILSAGYNTELGSLKPHASWTEESLIILDASLIDPSSKKVLARFTDWPEPYRYLRWPTDTRVTVSVQSVKNDKTNTDNDTHFENLVTITANQPLKGCWLEPVYDGNEKEDEPEPLWDDNMFDILPGQEVEVGVNGLRGRKVNVRFLADWEVGQQLPATNAKAHL
ncbi:uncharacterized protein Z519_00377 [Cladophialophora bantiana CBS 173.52]|uniref:Beta-mannosidase B n=1 Tax=Cladophialophora bantiana (strain ATCC 10958 / CBS 173.52 / CDC B-1940 / NIH 8579) TaxID=1442370 RepID=A0A0D2I614_CLAB1|nr:uncharacterized protein Z519_00377 [Cladophialophora bantiana CBS 173.52]KIW98715.1 hypothetical protein Z519_00377 [Cladophialophora bantiana CBS 173.52]